MKTKINWIFGMNSQLSWLWTDFHFSPQLGHFSYLQYSSMNFILTNSRVINNIRQEQWSEFNRFKLQKFYTQNFWENDLSQTHQNKEVVEQKWFNFLHSWLYCPQFLNNTIWQKINKNSKLQSFDIFMRVEFWVCPPFIIFIFNYLYSR